MSEKVQTKLKRKDQILNAAFSLAHANVSWSMTDLAQRVGVSKTALYRHFSNRAEIEAVMESRTLEKLLTAIEAGENNADSIRSTIVTFFRANPSLFMYLTRNIITVENFQTKTLTYLKNNSPRIQSFFEKIDNLPIKDKKKRLIGIQKNVITLLLVSFNEKALLSLQNQLLSRNSTGFPELAIPSEQRFAELEALRIEEEEPNEIDSKLLQAVADAVREQGVPNVTIENIAGQLGTAKSSLYSHYKNKKAMLSKLINGEIQTIFSLIDQNVALGNTFEEQLYLVMLIHMRHLMNKPEIIPVFNWIRYEMITQHYDIGRPEINPEKFLSSFKIQNEEKTSYINRHKIMALIRWVATLSSSCSIIEYEAGSTEKDILKFLRIMYKHVLYGDKELL